MVGQFNIIAAAIGQAAGDDEIVFSADQCAVILRRVTARVFRQHIVGNVAIFDSHSAASQQHRQKEKGSFAHYFPLGLAARHAFTAFSAPDT